MKMHLISLSPSIWSVVDKGVDLPDSDYEGELTLEQQKKIHQNAQAATVLMSSLDHEEFDRVDGLERAKDIWKTLRDAHEGTRHVRKAKIEMLESKLDRFCIREDETAQDMYNRLKVMINKIRAYGSKRWNDRRVVRKMLRAYVARDVNICSLIRENPAYKKMTPNDVLGRIINHQMFIEDAMYVKNMANNMEESKKQEVALKASKKSKCKHVVVESSSDEENDESSDVESDDMALFIRRFKKLMKNGSNHKKDKSRTRSKKVCYNCGKYGHFIANCTEAKREDNEGKKKKFNKDKRTSKKKYSGEAHIGQEWDSNEEEPDSDNERIATIAINNASSSKSLFPNLNNGKGVNHKCLMAKESKRKVKRKSSSSRKYVSSDDDCTTNNDDTSGDESDDESDDETWLRGLSKKAIKKISELMMQVSEKDELLEKQETLLVLEKKGNEELKSLLELEKEKNGKVNQELAKSKEDVKVLESSNVALQEAYEVLQKTHKELEVQFDTLWSSTSSSSSSHETSKGSTSKGCERCYKIDDAKTCVNHEKIINK